MAHKVKCYYCGEIFDRDKEASVAVPDKARRYAHKDCFEKNSKIEQENEQYKIQLEEYIKNLFGYKKLPEPVKKQIRQYTIENNYSYLGILRALKYHYEIKHGSKEKAYGRIGIVPYVYDEAHNYYLALWQARQKNEIVAKKIEEYITPTLEVHIPIPERKPMKNKRKLFAFLEDNVIDNREVSNEQ